MVNPDNVTAERLRENNVILSKFHKHSGVSFSPEPIHFVHPQTELFYIYGIIRKLVVIFQRNNETTITWVRNFSRIFSVIAAAIPTIHKISDFGASYFNNASWYEYYITAISAFQ